uniref:Multifunctional fusion protein n=1 Tax=Olisthodiscus luteus TaxID=83000 RepID=A0A7U0QGC6_OLILU|nr:ribulose-1,5-bisphosphate carboxylase/oxygenase small subunit [Olisthodiscus luteus]QQW50545.1 ribulose-1,5-bisphosphate carboxylase/oxygenase small subunit [Olisthodiscus luteus]
MRLTQGAFSFLPDLTDEQIKSQAIYAISKGWSVSVEYTDDPHPRNAYWELWGLPLFDIKDPAAVIYEVNECRKTFGSRYIKCNAFDASRGTESCVMSFIVNRPSIEPGFYLDRQETDSRFIRYTINSYSVQRQPEGIRY